MSKTALETARKRVAAEIERQEELLLLYSNPARVESFGETPEALEWRRQHIQDLRRLLAQYDSLILERKAARLGIEIPRKPEWYHLELSDLEADKMRGEQKVDRFLNHVGRAAVTNMINDARFAKWSRWAGLLVPILALVIAILALFKDIIVEVLKNKF